MAMVNDNNFFNIAGWMVTKLRLKGTELMVFAIIYGFSQAEGNEYTASRKYLAEFTGATTKTIDNCLQSLVEKNLIIKREEYINNVKFNRYRVNLEGIEKFSTPPVEKISTNNKYIYNKYNNNISLSNNNINIRDNEANNIDTISEQEKAEQEKLEIDLIEEIINTYPRKGFDQKQAITEIKKAIQCEYDRGLNICEAVNIIRYGTRMYIQAVKKWSNKDKKYISNLIKFFQNRMYLEDPIIWEKENKQQGASDYEEYIPTN